MSSGTATWIGVGATSVLLVAVLVWALVRHQRSARREDWVALESMDGDDLGRHDDRDEPVDGGEPDEPDKPDEPVDGGEPDEPDKPDEPDGDRSRTSAEPAHVELPDAVLDADGDLRANDEIAMIVDANGIVVALTKPARRRLEADTGGPYTEVARLRPVAGAEDFDPAHNPISRALEGAHVDRSPCVVQTATSTLAGVISAQPVVVGDDEVVLVHLEVA